MTLNKKPKLQHEVKEEEEEEEEERTSVGIRSPPKEEEEEEEGEGNSIEEQEEALVALIEHRNREVQHLKKRISYYNSQLAEAEKRLDDSQSQLARLRARSGLISSKASRDNGTRNHNQSRKDLVSLKSEGPGPRVSARSSPSDHSIMLAKVKVEKPHRSSSNAEVVETKDRGTKRKLEQKEHKDLIPLVRSSSSPCTIRCHASNHISSQHKRKLRCLALCPANDQLFVTSALDGAVNLWQIQSRGSGASLLSSTNCVSATRWPEDIAWRPSGDSIVCTYVAEGGVSQIAVLNLNKTREDVRVAFLEDKPHRKGSINSITFMPWESACFATGGSDHAVILWNEKDGETVYKPKVLHREFHSSAVMAVCGMQQKQIVLSAGADKKVIGFDVLSGRAEFKYQLDSKCMSVLPNPCDFNLFMVQTGTPEKQLRLFDARLRQTEIHSFGFKQESSDSMSALINQAWSSDGLYLTSGSVDPVIHIFDIRYNSNKPSQSVRAHQKRVFKAVWHYSLPLLISISSDLNIGLHKIS